MDEIKYLMESLYKWFMGWVTGGPHFRVGSPDSPYMLRWYVIPRNHWFNIYLHKFLKDDDDRALHDHPWASFSVLLWGSYREHTPDGVQDFGPGSLIYRNSEYRHRVELIDRQPAWTLFMTGPTIRVWGFWCPQGFVKWTDFVDQDDHGNTGRGCGEVHDRSTSVASSQSDVY